MSEPFVLIHGNDPHLVRQEALRLRAKLAEGLDSSLELEEFNASADIGAIERSVTTLPFLTSRRVVFIWDPPQADGRSTAQAGELAEAIGRRCESTAVCVVVRSTLLSTSPLLKGLKAAGAEVRSFTHSKGRDLRQHVNERVKASGLNLGPLVIGKLLAVAGADLGQLDVELEKLAIFGRGGLPITEESGNLLVTSVPATELYKLTDAIFEQPAQVGARLRDALSRPGMQPHVVIGAVARVCRELLAFSEGAESTAPDWKQEKLRSHLAKAGAARLKNWLVDLADLDIASRSGDVEAVPGLEARLAAMANEIARPRPMPALALAGPRPIGSWR